MKFASGAEGALPPTAPVPAGLPRFGIVRRLNLRLLRRLSRFLGAAARRRRAVVRRRRRGFRHLLGGFRRRLRFDRSGGFRFDIGLPATATLRLRRLLGRRFGDGLGCRDRLGRSGFFRGAGARAAAGLADRRDIGIPGRIGWRRLGRLL
jgi:hypothetical protein